MTRTALTSRSAIRAEPCSSSRQASHNRILCRCCGAPHDEGAQGSHTCHTVHRASSERAEVRGQQHCSAPHRCRRERRALVQLLIDIIATRRAPRNQRQRPHTSKCTCRRPASPRTFLRGARVGELACIPFLILNCCKRAKYSWITSISSGTCLRPRTAPDVVPPDQPNACSSRAETIV
jgi:hypothetical protein